MSLYVLQNSQVFEYVFMPHILSFPGIQLAFYHWCQGHFIDSSESRYFSIISIKITKHKMYDGHGRQASECEDFTTITESAKGGWGVRGGGGGTPAGLAQLVEHSLFAHRILLVIHYGVHTGLLDIAIC